MSKEKKETAWSYAAERLPQLKIIHATIICWNGGETMQTTFYSSNSAGLCGVQFEHGEYGLACPDDIHALTIGSPWRERNRKAELTIEVQSPKQMRGDRGVGRTAGWVDHEAMILKYFGEEARQWAEIAKLNIQLEDENNRLQNLQRHLTDVRAL